MELFDQEDPQPELRAIVWGCQSCGWTEDAENRVRNEEGEWHPPTVCPLCEARGMKGIRGLTAETWEAMKIKKKWSPFQDDEDEDEAEDDGDDQ